MDTLRLSRIRRISGSVTLPGSKSLANRALLLAALSRGQTRLINVPAADDPARMTAALRRLGVTLTGSGSTTVVTGLDGVFDTGLDQVDLDLGNAGTAMRPLCAVLAVSRGCFRLTGEPRMLERPIGPLVEALRTLGLSVNYLNNPGFPPLEIWGREPAKHEAELPGNISSQFISALLLAAPMCGGLKIRVQGDLISRPYVDLTLKIMKAFGALTERTGYSFFEVAGSGYVSPGEFLIEGDASGATYFAAAAAVAGEVEIRGLGKDSCQGDADFLKVLASMGAQVTWGEHSVTVRRGSPLKGLTIDMNAMPDAAMTLVPLALYTDSPVTVTNIGSWRVKETDRIAALAAEMSKLGVKVTTGSDYISVDASERNQEIPVFSTYRDHRMAMCLSLAALDREIVIEDPGCVSKTFPGYFEALSRVSHRA